LPNYYHAVDRLVSRVDALEEAGDKFKGEYLDSEVSSIDTTGFTGGEEIIVTDIPTRYMWSATLEDWV
jgi:hypothetical protein